MPIYSIGKDSFRNYLILIECVKFKSHIHLTYTVACHTDVNIREVCNWTICSSRIFVMQKPPLQCTVCCSVCCFISEKHRNNESKLCQSEAEETPSVLPNKSEDYRKCNFHYFHTQISNNLFITSWETSQGGWYPVHCQLCSVIKLVPGHE